MSFEIVESVKARAEEEGVVTWTLWHVMLRVVRDQVLTKAQAEGRGSIVTEFVYDAVRELYPWLSEERNEDAEPEDGCGSETFRVAMAALTYGCGAGYWEMTFYEEDGETLVPLDEVRAAIESNSPRKAEILIRWVLKPDAKISEPVVKKVARVVSS